MVPTTPRTGQGGAPAGTDGSVVEPSGSGVVIATLSAIPGVASVDVGPDHVRVVVAQGFPADAVGRAVGRVLSRVFGVPGSAITAEPESPEAHLAEDTAAVTPPSSSFPHAREAAEALTPVPVPRLTVIRGGRDDAPAHPLAGAVASIPDVDLDMLRETVGRHPAGHALAARERLERIRQRERSAWVPPLLEEDVPRPVLVRLRTTSSAGQTSIVVTLRFAGMLIEGSAETVPTAAATRLAVVEATLAALRRVLSARVALEAIGVQIVELPAEGPLTDDSYDEGAEDVALVRVRVIDPIATEHLTGVSTVRDDSRAAIARATLDAVNRRIQALYEG